MHRPIIHCLKGPTFLGRVDSFTAAPLYLINVTGLLLTQRVRVLKRTAITHAAELTAAVHAARLKKSSIEALGSRRLFRVSIFPPEAESTSSRSTQQAPARDA